MRKKDELSVERTCMQNAHPEEMTFVLLSRDAAAPAAIRAWTVERIRLGKNAPGDPQIIEAMECAATMEREGRLWVDEAPLRNSEWAARGGLSKLGRERDALANALARVVELEGKIHCSHPELARACRAGREFLLTIKAAPPWGVNKLVSDSICEHAQLIKMLTIILDLEVEAGLHSGSSELAMVRRNAVELLARIRKDSHGDELLARIKGDDHG